MVVVWCRVVEKSSRIDRGTVEKLAGLEGVHEGRLRQGFLNKWVRRADLNRGKMESLAIVELRFGYIVVASEPLLHCPENRMVSRFQEETARENTSESPLESIWIIGAGLCSLLFFDGFIWVFFKLITLDNGQPDSGQSNNPLAGLGAKRAPHCVPRPSTAGRPARP